MNSYKNKIQCQICGNTSKTAVNTTYTQVSLENNNNVNYMSKNSIMNYKENSAPDKVSDELDEVLEKLLIAYEYMTPAVEEIVNTVSDFVMPKMQTCELDDPICSITTEQYDEVIKAIMLIKEATSQKKLENKSMLPKFSLDRFLGAIKRSIKVGSVATSTFRVYLEKNVVNELVLLYKLLFDEIQEINSSDCESEITPAQRRMSSISQKLQSNMIENSEKLACLEAEYQALSDTINILKSVISETTGSGCDVMSTTKSNLDVSRKIKPSSSVSSLKTNQCITDVSGARRCILECLYELTEVRRQLKFSNSKEDVETQSDTHSCISNKNCCDNRDIPHLHAKLNGIPIVLTLNKIRFLNKCLKRYTNYIVNAIKTVTISLNNNKTNKLDRYGMVLYNVHINQNSTKHRSVYTITSSNYHTYPINDDKNLRLAKRDRLSTVENYSQNYWSTPTNIYLQFSNDKDIKLKLHYYIYLSDNMYEHMEKVYEVRFFEIEHDQPSKESTPKKDTASPITKTIYDNTDDFGWSSDILEVRVFEFKQKHIPKAQKAIEQFKTKPENVNDNLQSSSTKKIKSNTDTKQDPPPVKEDDSNKSLKEQNWNIYNNHFIYRDKFGVSQFPNQQQKAVVQTCSKGVNTGPLIVNRGFLNQSFATFNITSSKDNNNAFDFSKTKVKEVQTPQFIKKCKELDTFINHNVNILPNEELINSFEWKTNAYMQRVQYADIPTKVINKYVKNTEAQTKSVQCNFLKVNSYNMYRTSLPKCLKQTVSLNKDAKTTSDHRVSNIKSNNKNHMVHKRLCNVSRSSEKCWKVAVNQNGFKKRLKHVLNEETIYSIKVNPKFRKDSSSRTSRCTSSGDDVDLININQKIPKKTKSKSTSDLINLQKSLQIGDCSSSNPKDLKNLIINLMQAEASIVFENLDFKISDILNQHASIDVSSKNKTSQDNKEKQKCDRVGSFWIKEEVDSINGRSIENIPSTYSNVQFVYGDTTPTQNHKIFGVRRSLSNNNRVIVECPFNKCRLNVNVEKNTTLAKKNFDYSKYSSLAEHFDDPPRTNEKLKSNYKEKNKDEKYTLDYSSDSSCVQLHCDKGTQLPPVIYRNRSLLKKIQSVLLQQDLT